MPTFSCFQDFVGFRFSNKATRGEAIYRGMIASVQGAFDVTPGTYEEGRIYATAMGLARARYALERAGNQANPLKAIELLGLLEQDWNVIPKETDGILARQTAVAARQLLPLGPRRENVETQLKAIYGTDFLAYRTFTSAEIATWPSAPFNGAGNIGNFTREDTTDVPKYFKLVDPITTPFGSTINVHYAPMQAGDPSVLNVGDVVTIQVENLGLVERTVVTSSGVDAGGLYFTAVCFYAHDQGATVYTGTSPVWNSTQRYAFIVVNASAASDVEKYRRASEVMNKIARGVSQWVVVQPSSPGATTVGPFTLNITPLGTVPIGTLPILPLPAPFFAPSVPNVPAAGGTVIKLYGQNLTGVTSVLIDGVGVSFTPIDDNSLSLTTAAHAAGSFVSITVTTAAGGTVTIPNLLSFGLNISSLLPFFGSQNGGTALTIKGYNFNALGLPVLTVLINGFGPVGGFVIVDDHTITCTTDLFGAAGAYNVSVDNGVVAVNSPQPFSAY